MILFVRRLLQKESEADRQEFIRGITGSADPNKVKQKIAVGLVAGYVLSRRNK